MLFCCSICLLLPYIHGRRRHCRGKRVLAELGAACPLRDSVLLSQLQLARAAHAVLTIFGNAGRPAHIDTRGVSLGGPDSRKLSKAERGCSCRTPTDEATVDLKAHNMRSACASTTLHFGGC